MGLDFGYIDKYFVEKGYGFLSSTVDLIDGVSKPSSPRGMMNNNSNRGVFFHVTQIGAGDIELRLKNDDYNGIGFWYDKVTSYDNAGRLKPSASHIWLDKSDIPIEKLKDLTTVIEQKWHNTNYRISQTLKNFTSNLFGDERREELEKGREELENEKLRELVEKQKIQEESKQVEIAKREAERQQKLAEEKEREQSRQVQLQRVIESDSEIEVKLFLESANTADANLFWNDLKLRKKLAYQGFLWTLLPPQIKVSTIEKHFNSFLPVLDGLLDKISIYKYKKYVEVDASDIYTNLDDRDKELASSWLSDRYKENEHEVAKMRSARAAEKAVLKCYSNFGRIAKDISVQQLSIQGSDEWKKYDILVNGKIAIDVKNARRSMHNDKDNKSKYSEFCVPRFKTSRNQEVIIAGILSPYLNLEYINDTSKYESKYNGNKVKSLIFLGEIQNSVVENIERTFVNDKLESITIPRESNSKYIPPWLFDYPDYFYCNQIEVINYLSKLEWEEESIPSWEDILLTTQSTRYVQLFISCNIRPPTKWMNHLSSWEQIFIDKLIYHKNRITLPYLFVSLLSHFLDILATNDLEYHPKKYASFLPLGIYDPLSSISDLIEILSTLWDNRAEMKIHDFCYFQFDGRGILKGKKSSSERFTTILAYCGGKSSGGGACGYAPLLQNKHETCLKCKSLKCPSCSYCMCQYKKP